MGISFDGFALEYLESLDSFEYAFEYENKVILKLNLATIFPIWRLGMIGYFSKLYHFSRGNK